MQRRLLIILSIWLVNHSYSQSIPQWKIEEVVRSYNHPSDTIYVINFWSTWCQPCLEEIPYMEKISKKYASKKVKLLLVSLDSKKTFPKLPDIIKKRKITAHVVWLEDKDADRFCPAIDSSWSGAIPATLIIQPNKGIRKFYEDKFSEKSFEEALKYFILPQRQ